MTHDLRHTLRGTRPFWLPGLTIWTLLYMALLYNYGYVHGDEGCALMGGWRIYLGEVPSRDVFMGPPFHFLPTALFFRLFGPTFLAARLLTCLYAWGLILSSDLLLRRFTHRLSARCLVISFLIPYGVFSWPLPSHHWVVAICQILSLWSLLVALECAVARFRWAFLSGVFAGLACFSIQDQGGYQVLLLAAFFFPWLRDRKARKELFLGWAAGGLCVAALFAVWLLPHVSFGELFYQWFVFPATRYRHMPGNRGSLAALGWQQIGSPVWLENLRLFPAYVLPQTFFTLFLPFMPLVAGGILVWAAWRGRMSRSKAIVLGAGLAAFAGGCLHRFAQTNLIWIASIPMLIIAWGLERAAASGKKLPAALARAGLAGLTAASLLYSVGYLHMTIRRPKTTVAGRAGALVVPANSTQSSMQLVLDAVETHVPEGAPLFCTQYNPIICFWTQRPNPTRFDFMATGTGMHTEEQVDQAIQLLRDRPDAHILLFSPTTREHKFNRFALDNYTPVWRAPWAVLLAPPARADLPAQPPRATDLLPPRGM